MQAHPTNWQSLLSTSHFTEYKYVIDGVDYLDSDIQGTPSILKPLMDRPCIGRCCSGTVTLSVLSKPNVTIPKAATVNVYTRLSSADGNTKTSWIEQGKYYVSKRSRNAGRINLTCRDRMLKASVPYLEHTQITQWPATMEYVVNEIAAIMEVNIDLRTVIQTGADYMVDRPNEDTLMSEVLAHIAAAHFGNFIMSETGKLRLVPFIDESRTVCQAISTNYKSYTPISQQKKISRITLADNAGNEFTAGNDAGIELYADCMYATQNIVDAAAEFGFLIVRDNRLSGVKGSFSGHTITIDNEGYVENKTLYLEAYGGANSFIPYRLLGAYIDPCLELGDKISISYKGETIELILASMTIRCNKYFNSDVSFEMEEDDEDEFPYTDLKELEAERAVSTHKTYFGNVINREEGFVSKRIEDGNEVARLIANADAFAMQQLISGEWIDRIYFDAAEGKYHITGEVKIDGVIVAADLAGSGTTVINGDNITTGIIRSVNDKIVIDLNNGTITIDADDVAEMLKVIENRLTLLASSQMFTKAGDSEAYSPSSITLTAATAGTFTDYKWYKEDVLISGATRNTITISPSDITGRASTYKVVCTDQNGNTYTALMTIAKVSDGGIGEDGNSTALVYLYKRSATAPSIDWSSDLVYSFSEKSLTSVPSGWSATIPDGSYPLYVTAATAFGNTDTVILRPADWATPSAMAKSGLNSATIFLYQRASSSPSLPTGDITYTFATGVATGSLGSWRQMIPLSDGNPCYVIQASAVSSNDTDVIASSEWSIPTVFVEDGTSIESIIAQYYLSTSDVTPTGGEWSTTVPAYVDGYYIWTRNLIEETDGSEFTTTPVLDNALNNLGSQVSACQTAIQINKDNIQMNTDYYTQLNGQVAEINHYITTGIVGYDSGGDPIFGVKIGRTDLTSAFKSMFTATALEFYEADELTTFLTNRKLNTNTIRVSKFELVEQENMSDPSAVDWQITLDNGFSVKYVGA